MKLSKYIIPYPVLGIEGAFDDNCKVGSTMTFETTQDNYIFHIHLEIDEEMILDLIDQEKASFSCEVDCARTNYRKIFTTKNKDFDIEIPRTSLVGNVHFFFSIVALREIPNYKNSKSNQKFYQGYKFHLQKGDLLSYLGETRFNADIKYEELKALGSIVEVKEDSKEKYTHYDFSKDKIRIFLPTEEFKDFKRSNNQRLADITHASIVQCGLISALHAFSQYKNTLWAQTLIMRCKIDPNLKDFKSLEDLEGLQISKIVNVLLDNANKRMFSTLDSIRNNIA